jgi:putative membrane protein
MKKIFVVILVAVLSTSIACNRSRSSEKGGSTGESQAPQGMGSNQAESSQGGAAQMSSADHNFVMNAAKGGKAEVELGTLASQQATNPAVKQFGERMVKDHTEANNRLQQIAQQKGMTLPNDLPDDAKQLKERLTNMKGPEFDRTYMQNMVQDHQKDVAEFQQEADQGQDPDIKNFAATTLPTLKEHLQLAQTDLSKIKK